MKIPFSFRISLLSLIVLSHLLAACKEKTTLGDKRKGHTIVPAPNYISLSGETFDLSYCTLVFEGEVSESLLQLTRSLFPRNENTPENNCSQIHRFQFELDAQLPSDNYTIEIKIGAIKIRASEERGFIYGLVSLAQLQDEHGHVPIGVIDDGPAYDYRALMVDLSRNWHSVNSLKQLIALCGWYKIKYMQLHLTDDGLFTFPSDAFPTLASEKHYSKADLETLNIFAKAHGVILVPEIDMPGHSSAFIRANPKKWGIKKVSQNPYTLNMGKEEVYEGINMLLHEVAQAFPDSPYIHIGGDEVYTEGFAEDTEIREYMNLHGLSTPNDLYHHFIVRVAQQVKDLGRTPIIWTGFEHDSSVIIPKDIIVMAWTMSYEPRQLVAEGYKVINASWKPLYVVNNRKWSPELIYDWTPFKWKGFDTPDALNGHVIDSTAAVLGGSMSTWEQGQYKELTTLRKRLPAMSEKLWSLNKGSYQEFEQRLTSSDKKFDNYLFPFSIEEEGLVYGNWEDANRYENLWFEDSLKITLLKRNKNLTYRYTSDNRNPNSSDPEFGDTVELGKTCTLSIQAFDSTGKTVGECLEKKYFLAPIRAEISGLVNDVPPHSWENHKFTDSIEVVFRHHRPGMVKYTTDGTRPTNDSPTYKSPFILKMSTTIQARLFDIDGNPIGIPWSEEYVLLGVERSLTTGKPVTTFNGEDEMGPTSFINDGEIARWDHWGSHTNGNNWIIVDLEKPYEIDKFKTYTFWDGYRYYEYTIDVSLDTLEWKRVVDRSANREISVPEGIIDSIEATNARYIKLTLLRNSANPGLHLVEFQTFEKSKTDK